MGRSFTSVRAMQEEDGRLAASVIAGSPTMWQSSPKRDDVVIEPTPDLPSVSRVRALHGILRRGREIIIRFRIGTYTPDD